jgi:hypothetical protein
LPGGASLHGVDVENNKNREEQMLIDRVQGADQTSAPSSWRCPFFNPAGALCQAALWHRTPPKKVRASTCACGDHEDCTTFLVRLLNRPPARLR